ncbi:hypothetical protein PR003_g13086 [Phytophthora rubi]|nr:hypothetical protein PR001_g11362 [Phytophthora rubi]KAE9335294.1 hypothetical protein PR003_g13086 [Phytophthora rubi]
MVESIEKQYVNLARWIQKNEIRASDLLRGEVDEKACSKAKKICPSYCDLVPVFHEFNFDIEVPSSSSSSPSSSSSAREDKANGDEAEEKEEKEDDVKEVEDKEDKEDDVTEVEANEDKAGTVAPEKVDATAGHKRSIEEISQYRPLSSSAKSLTKRGVSLHRARSQSIACKLDYEMASKREIFNTEQAKRQCAIEIERFRLDGEKWRSETERYRAEIMQARMEAERARTATEQHLGEVQRERYDMTLRVDGVTSRHELAAKGVASEEIDQVLPL